MAGGAPTTTTGGPPTSSSSNPISSSGLPPPPPPPKILLAKPGSGPAASRFGREDETPPVVIRSRNAPQLGSLNLLSDSWEFHTDRVLPFLTENSDFTVIGVIGPPGVGKSTIMNELYGFDGSSPGMLPPFATQSEETRAMARHCTVGIELRVSAERLILLDAQPIFSPSVLTEMMRPDGSSAIPVLNGESLSADLAHELMGIQVDLLKHGIPDASLLTSGPSHGSTSGPDRESKDNMHTTSGEYIADPVFVHTKLRDQDFSPSSIMRLRKALSHYFCSSFNVHKCGNMTKAQVDSSMSFNKETNDPDSTWPDLFLLPFEVQGDLQKAQYESYSSMLGKLRDQILSINCHSFTKTVSERDWLRNSAKIWELVKRSPIIADYCKTLQSSGLFRR